MKLVNELLLSVSVASAAMEKVLIGHHWISVTSRKTGMSHAFRGGEGFELKEAGELEGKDALQTASLLKSWQPLEASLGLAALNSLIEPSGENVNLVDFIMSEAPGKTVTCVGRFPFFPELSRTAARAYLLEINPVEGELPSFAAEEVIPDSDLVVISGTSLINKTMERLLELSRKGTAVVLGPSTPMSEVLFDYGASAIGGVRVTDPDALFRSLSQGVKFYRKIAGVEPVTRFRR